MTTCGAPALYRIGSGQPQRLGGCAGNLSTEAATVEVRIGQELDLHMLTDAPTDGTLPPPLYPLPSSPDASILRLLGGGDIGATGRYQAVGPGAVLLVTVGSCIDSKTGEQTEGRPCPVVRVQVMP